MRVHNDSETSAEFARGRFALVSSDCEDEFDDFPAGADRGLEVVASKARARLPIAGNHQQDLCHPPQEMYAMFEGEECPPTARDGFR